MQNQYLPASTELERKANREQVGSFRNVPAHTVPEKFPDRIGLPHNADTVPAVPRKRRSHSRARASPLTIPHSRGCGRSPACVVITPGARSCVEALQGAESLYRERPLLDEGRCVTGGPLLIAPASGTKIRPEIALEDPSARQTAAVPCIAVLEIRPIIAPPSRGEIFP